MKIQFDFENDSIELQAPDSPPSYYDLTAVLTALFNSSVNTGMSPLDQLFKSHLASFQSFENPTKTPSTPFVFDPSLISLKGKSFFLDRYQCSICLKDHIYGIEGPFVILNGFYYSQHNNRLSFQSNFRNNLFHLACPTCTEQYTIQFEVPVSSPELDPLIEAMQEYSTTLADTAFVYVNEEKTKITVLFSANSLSFATYTQSWCSSRYLYQCPRCHVTYDASNPDRIDGPPIVDGRYIVWRISPNSNPPNPDPNLYTPSFVQYPIGCISCHTDYVLNRTSNKLYTRDSQSTFTRTIVKASIVDGKIVCLPSREEVTCFVNQISMIDTSHLCACGYDPLDPDLELTHEGKTVCASCIHDNKYISLFENQIISSETR